MARVSRWCPHCKTLVQGEKGKAFKCPRCGERWLPEIDKPKAGEAKT